MKKGFFYCVILLLAFKSWANACPEFEQALEKALVQSEKAEDGKVTLSQNSNSRTKSPTQTYKDWGSPRAQDYKVKYGADKIGYAQNRRFMQLMDDDTVYKRSLLHFDVENAAQKKLNDLILGDKGMVDAVNNSFFEKINKMIRNDRELMERTQAYYKDYKSLRYRFQLRETDDRVYFQNKLNEIYKKANDEFVAEFKASQLHMQIPPIADQATDVSTWFMAGMDDTPLLANMAARKAREMGFKNGNGKAVSFKEVVDSYFDDVVSMEETRKKLASSKNLVSSGVMAPDPDGFVIPSKEMIKILRKYKPNDATDIGEYVQQIGDKVKKMFGTHISDDEIMELTNYFKKVDSVSPPLFIRTRDKIDLGAAVEDIVSVDFAGVGVDNAYEQMRALAKMDYSKSGVAGFNKEDFLKKAFQNVQRNVDGVTDSMNKAKRFFSSVTIDPNKPEFRPVFSGDDGIFMPQLKWGKNEKVELVKKLADSGDPSKYRVTFVPTKFYDGSLIPVHQRSSRIVRAEDIEKKLREVAVAVDKIKPERAGRMIFAVESIPMSRGGKFNLIVGGHKLSEEEKNILNDSLKKVIDHAGGETFGEIIEVGL